MKKSSRKKQNTKSPSDSIRAQIKQKKGLATVYFLLRLSVHDPILPLNIESDASGGTEQIKEKLLGFFRSHGQGVDISPLERA